jgi:hypothetical protein
LRGWAAFAAVRGAKDVLHFKDALSAFDGIVRFVLGVRFKVCPALPENSNASDAFNVVSEKIDPPIPTYGGVMMEYWLVETPTHETFYSVLLRGDVEGWRKQIELGAIELGLKFATVIDSDFVVSDGSRYALSECSISLEDH